MNKQELVKKIAEVAGLSAADAKKALDATTETIKEALVAGDKVQLVGFGTFATKERLARKGVNPSTQEKIDIPAKTVVKFSASSNFDEAVNK